MAKGYSGMGGNFGGMNMNNMMKQAQQMQRRLAEAQEELAARRYEATSGGGAVKVVISGKKVVESIEIDKDVVDPEDVEMLQDLILTAVNEALRQEEEASQSEMGKLTGGVGLPF